MIGENMSSSTMSRSSLGPLTTSLLLPEECSINGAHGNSGTLFSFYQGQGCSLSTILDTSSCWPPMAPSLTAHSAPFKGYGFYSPGLVCPSGYTTACTSALLSNGADSPVTSGKTFSFQYPLEPGETAIGCCPT